MATPRKENPLSTGRGPDNLQRDEAVREYFEKNRHAQAGVPYYVKAAARYAKDKGAMKYASLHQVYVSIERLKRKGLMPKHQPKRASGVKTAPRPQVAALVAKPLATPVRPALGERTTLIIEAARTGLRVRLLVDGTIEVSP